MSATDNIEQLLNTGEGNPFFHIIYQKEIVKIFQIIMKKMQNQSCTDMSYQK